MYKGIGERVVSLKANSLLFELLPDSTRSFNAVVKQLNSILRAAPCHPTFRLRKKLFSKDKCTAKEAADLVRASPPALLVNSGLRPLIPVLVGEWCRWMLRGSP